MHRRKDPISARLPSLGLALLATGLVGGGWALDARRRRERNAHLHRTLVELLLNTLSAGDAFTARHSRRVADLTDALAGPYGLRGEARARLRVAALLHDLGKIDDRFFEIVHSPRRLTEEERARIQQHPHESAGILEPLESIHPGLVRIVESHHECWDGGGYPRGLRGAEIPIEARIISVADVFDALSQPRSYHAPLPVDQVLARLREEAGTRFDPELIRRLHTPALLQEWEAIAAAGRREEEDGIGNR